MPAEQHSAVSKRNHAPPALKRAAVAGVTVVVAVLAWAAPAYAHHPLISGEVSCPAGQQVIDWTVSHDEGGSGRSMKIEEVSVSQGTVNLEVGQVLPPPDAPGSTVQAVTVLPGDATGSVTLRIVGRWVDPNGRETDRVDGREATVKLLDECVGAAAPKATIVANCVEGGALVTLENTGGSATTFDVFKGTTKIDTVEVGPGATVTRTYPMTEDETASFRAVTPEGFDTGAVPVTFSCAAPAAPAATIVANCTTGGALVTLVNTGGSATTFDVFKGTTKLETHEVVPGQTVTRIFPMAEDETASFRAVTPTGFDTGAVSVTYDCVPAPATVVPTEVLGVTLTQPTPIAASVVPAPTATVTTVTPQVATSSQVAGVPLAKTGVETTTLVTLGLALVGLGLALTMASSRTSPLPVMAMRAPTAPLTRGWTKVLSTRDPQSTPRLRHRRAAFRRRFGG